MTLQAGYPAILPPLKSGLQVILGDRRQWLDSATNQNRLRCLFYVGKVLAQDERAQTEGIRSLQVTTIPRMRDLDPEFLRSALNIITKASQIKVHVHLICYPPRIGEHYFIQGIMGTWYKLFSEFPPVKAFDFDVHIEHEKGIVLRELLELGFQKEGIPVDLGGEWSFVQAAQWCRQQASEERRRLRKIKRRRKYLETKTRERTGEASLLQGGTPDRSVAEFESSFRATNSDAAQTAASPSQQSEEEKEEALRKKRAVNAIHSRRKRERRKHEFEMIKQEFASLTVKNKALKEENERLSNLLREARTLLE